MKVVATGTAARRCSELLHELPERSEYLEACRDFYLNADGIDRARNLEAVVLPPLSVGTMTLRLYGALNYSQNSARDLRRALNGA